MQCEGFVVGKRVSGCERERVCVSEVMAHRTNQRIRTITRNGENNLNGTKQVRERRRGEGVGGRRQRWEGAGKGRGEVEARWGKVRYAQEIIRRSQTENETQKQVNDARDPPSHRQSGGKELCVSTHNEISRLMSAAQTAGSCEADWKAEWWCWRRHQTQAEMERQRRK
jgi:hypothetical protein